MTDYGTFKRGRREFPLDPLSEETLLFDADPFLFYALEYFQAMIERHVGARLMLAASVVPHIKAPVAYAVPIDPMPFLLTAQYDFPLLAVYRKNGRLEQRTVAWRHDVTTFEVVYVTPPLTAAQAEAVVPILTAIRDVLDDRTANGADPSYTPKYGTEGESFWVDRVGLERVTFKEFEWGTIPEGKGLAFFALRMRGEVSEREDLPARDTEPFEGVDLDVDHMSPDGSRIAGVVSVSTRQPPTLSAVAPPTAAYGGGVALTLTGTLFHGPVRVFVGGKPATNVVRVSATQITCTSPVHEASAIGTALDVTVVTDFGAVTLPASLTLTA